MPERSHPSKDVRDTDDSKPPVPPGDEPKPTRFVGTVMIRADRPVREIHRAVIPHRPAHRTRQACVRRSRNLDTRKCTSRTDAAV